jgi:HSP20 family protein
MDCGRDSFFCGGAEGASGAFNATAGNGAGAGTATRNNAGRPNTKMNTLIRWNPLREFEAMQNRMSNLLARPLLPSGIDEPIGMGEWTPLVDVEESDKEYTIKAELPEVKKEDVKVEIQNGSLRISGERKLEKEEAGKRFHRVERSYGSFERSFSLPEGTKKGDLKAEFKDGLLKVHLPKIEEEKTKTLEIPVS